MTIPVCVLAVLSIVGGFDKAPFARFIATALPTLPEAVWWHHRNLIKHRRGPGFSMRSPGRVVLLSAQSRAGHGDGRKSGGPGVAPLLVLGLGNGLALRSALRPAGGLDRAREQSGCGRFYLRWPGEPGRPSAIAFSASPKPGRLRWYAAWIAGGTVAFVAIVMFL